MSASLAFPGLKPTQQRSLTGDPALDFPPISHLIEWPDLFGMRPVRRQQGRALDVARRRVVVRLLPGGRAQGSHDSCRAACRTSPSRSSTSSATAIILQTIGPDGMGFTPFLLTMFSFVFVCNILEIIPFVQMPVNARIALPMFLALVVVGHLQLRRHRASRACSATSRTSSSRRACPRRSTARRVHRVRHDHLRAAVLAGGPALRQHARRPPAAHHLRGALRRAVLVAPRRLSFPAPCSSP